MNKLKFEETIGTVTKTRIASWYQNPKKKCLVLMGRSGNGKTTYIKALAESLKLELCLIEPKDLNKETVKGINNSFTKKRIILIDDFDYVPKRQREHLYTVMKHSKFPVVVTCVEWKFRGDMFGKSQIIKVGKPRESEIISLILKNNSISRLLAREIAINSNSVQEALNASITLFIPSKENLYTSSKDKYMAIKNRDMKEELKKDNINKYFWAIRGYTPEAIQTMIMFAEYDYLIHSRYVVIDPYSINNTKVPIEKVDWEYVFRRYK